MDVTRRAMFRGAALLVAPLPNLEPLLGRWQYWGGQGGERVRLRAVDAVIEDIVWFARDHARSRILETNPIFDFVHVSRGDDVRIDCTDIPVVEGPVDGSPFRWTDAFKEKVTVRQHMRDATLVQKFRGRQGTRTFTYAPSGRWLRFGLHLDGALLPRPVRYKLWYRRV